MRTKKELVKICVQHLWRYGETEEDIMNLFGLSAEEIKEIVMEDYIGW